MPVSAIDALSALAAGPHGSDLLRDRWQPGMEAQVVPIDDESSPWQLHRLRIDSDAATIAYPLSEGTRDIGASGWSYRYHHSVWIGIDIDASDHAGGCSDDALATVETALRPLPYVELRRSTGGRGLHAYVTLTTPVPTASRAEHAALARFVVSRISADTGLDIGQYVDTAGRIMWLWSRRARAENRGLTPIQPAPHTLTIPADWQPPAASPAAIPSDLNDEHARILAALMQTGYATVWDAEHGCIRTHTVALRIVHERLKLRGEYDTISAGRHPGEPNCYCYPLPGGALRVCRYGDVTEPSWGGSQTIYHPAPDPLDVFRRDPLDSLPEIEYAADLLARLPERRPVIINGLLRRGESMNLISASKVGKSWLTYGLILSLISGRRWLDTFSCLRGRVLLADNELHDDEISHRLRIVAQEMGVPLADDRESFAILRLRGRGVDIDGLGTLLERRVTRGDFDVLILDSLYRFLPAGISENDNGAVTQLYNRLDQYAAEYNASIVAIHHTSKGNQSQKSVTDTGSGAGAMSRAVDAHVILRPHAEDHHVVLDAALRSFPPVDPLVLKWAFPLWLPAAEKNPELLAQRPTRQSSRQKIADDTGIKAILAALEQHGPLVASRLASAAEMRRKRFDRLTAMLVGSGRITVHDVKSQGGPTTEFRLAV